MRVVEAACEGVGGRLCGCWWAACEGVRVGAACVGVGVGGRL